MLTPWRVKSNGANCWWVDDCLYLHWYFPEEERMMHHSNGKYSLSYETKVINPAEEPSNTM